MDRSKAGASPINTKALIGQTLYTTPANTYITAGPSAATYQHINESKGHKYSGGTLQAL